MRGGEVIKDYLSESIGHLRACREQVPTRQARCQHPAEDCPTSAQGRTSSRRACATLGRPAAERTALAPWPAPEHAETRGAAMTDTAELPAIKRWRITMADNTVRTIEARGFRVEHGALVLVQPHGCAAAYAPSMWLSIEAAE